jgi:hypothetical protein
MIRRRNERTVAKVSCAWAGLALCLTGCGGSTQQVGGSPDAAADLGSINAEFRLPSGSASTASYRLTGPGFSQASMLDFEGSQAVGFLINDVPAGSYTLAFTATNGDGGESCSGTTSIAVQAGTIAMVNLDATCVGGPYVPTGYGSIDTWVSVPMGTTVTAATCTLTGPAGTEVPGRPLMWSSGSGLHFELTQIPAGPGQVLVISGAATDGKTCENSIAVDVTANETAEAMLELVCK